MPRRPSGTTTFLFTDIEGSTALLQRLGDTQYTHVLTKLRRLLRLICRRERGREIGHQGDGLFMAFPRARDAIAAAVAAQLAILEQRWPEDAVPQVRMGVHTGEPAANAGEFVGLDLHRAARICGAGHGGQILVSATTRALLEPRPASNVMLLDLGSHRLRNLQQPEQIFQVVHPDLRRDFPPLRSADGSANNLPQQVTSFVGREREVAEVTRRLSMTSILTLTGIGGCGKTRLALEVAGDLVGTYKDGVWLVELASLEEPGLVSNTVASALGVISVPGATLDATLLEYLRPRRLLLVLDNCEHLASSCAALVDTLSRFCPHLRILATSREPLGVRGEVVWQVPPLSLPLADRPVSIEELLRYEAPQLFLDRVALTRADFAPAAQDIGAIVRVCRRLDGIPLAIELAAARMQVLSIQQIAARLDEKFRLLTGGSRTAASRQRTLRGALDWSYDLLTLKERLLMRRLAVFAGSWTIEAAESICRDEGLDASEILDVLSQLVSKSLVIMQPRADGGEFRMLETVREYAQERLDNADETVAVRTRHLHWYLDLAERAEKELGGADQATWLRRLEREYENLRAALEWSKVDESTGDVGLRLAEALWQLWYVRGDFSEGRMWLETMLSRLTPSESLRARALREAGFLAWRQGDYDVAARLGSQGLAIFRDLGDLAGMGGAVYLLGNVAFYQGQLEHAKALHLESLVLRRKVGDKRRIAISLNSLGEVARAEGDFAAADACYQESLQLAREAGDTRATATATGNLGYVALRQGDHERAAKFLKEGLVYARQLVHKLGIAGFLTGLAGVAAATEQYNRAAHLLGATQSLLNALDVSLTTPDRLQYDLTREATLRALGEHVFNLAVAEGGAMTLDQAIDYALDDRK
jgi:predicted ATPase/class 3 adenylate cyclase